MKSNTARQLQKEVSEQNFKYVDPHFLLYIDLFKQCRNCSFRFAPFNVSKIWEHKKWSNLKWLSHTRNIPSMGSDNEILCHYIISYKPILMCSVSFTRTSYSKRISFSISYSVKTLIPHFEVLIFFETVKVVLNFFNLS